MYNVKVIGPEQWANSGDTIASFPAMIGPCRLYTVVVYNIDTVDRYVLVYDRNSPPVTGTAWIDMPPVACFRVGADAQGALDFGIGGRGMKNGIIVMISSANTPLTIAGQCLIDVGYRRGNSML